MKDILEKLDQRRADAKLGGGQANGEEVAAGLEMGGLRNHTRVTVLSKVAGWRFRRHQGTTKMGDAETSPSLPLGCVVGRSPLVPTERRLRPRERGVQGGEAHPYGFGSIGGRIVRSLRGSGS